MISTCQRAVDSGLCGGMLEGGMDSDNRTQEAENNVFTNVYVLYFWYIRRVRVFSVQKFAFCTCIRIETTVVRRPGAKQRGPGTNAK